MSAVTIRNLPDATHHALKERALRAGRSTEAEIREILTGAVQPSVGLGTQLQRIGQKLGGVNLPDVRDRSPIQPARFD
jgi:antitoxin FitA